MTKSELVAAVAAKTELSSAKTAEVVNAIVEAIIAEVKGGGKVSIQGFGTFSQKERAARTAKNPNTGATIQVAAKKVAKFSPGSGFQD
jgi:DNA-binding protein HU-beta